MKNNTFPHPLRTKILLLILTFLTIELALRAGLFLNQGNSNAFLNIVSHWDTVDFNLKWKIRFLKMYENMDKKLIPISQNEYIPDSDLGWVPKPNLSFTNNLNQSYTTNSLGFRSNKEFKIDESKYNILILGDSFTYGSWADDSEVWPTILQSKDASLNILNFAVGGYGTDQMAMMLEKKIKDYKPDLLIFAFIANDMRRSLLEFRDYWKPYYTITNNNLEIVGRPVPPLPDGLERVKKELEKHELKKNLRSSRLINLLLNSGAFLIQRTSARDIQREEEKLNGFIFSRVKDIASQNNCELLFLYLPWGKELTNPSFTRREYSFVQNFSKDNNINLINPRPLFLKRKTKFSAVHYRMPAATVVADFVYTNLSKLQTIHYQQ